jgi:FkbM family methyltransferase
MGSKAMSRRREDRKPEISDTGQERNQGEDAKIQKKQTRFLATRPSTMLLLVVLGVSLWHIAPFEPAPVNLERSLAKNGQNSVVNRHKLPTPYTQRFDSDAGTLITQTIIIHGVSITVGVRKSQDMANIKDHVSGEINGYALMKDAVLAAASANPKERPLVLDVGSNHGIYSLFAAKLGAEVITLEPQESLCKVINEVAILNKVEKQITLYHNAALDQYKNVTLENADVGEGGIATLSLIQRVGEETVKTLPIRDFVLHGEHRRITFLKIDVEGFELHAIPSAGTLLNQVDNILVEFGPPARWSSSAGDDAMIATTLLKDMHATHGMEPRLIDSLAWPTHLGNLEKEERQRAKKHKSVSLTTARSRQALMDSMIQSRSESYIWFVANAKSRFPTFEKACGGNHSPRMGSKTGPDRIMNLYGCSTDADELLS